MCCDSNGYLRPWRPDFLVGRLKLRSVRGLIQTPVKAELLSKLQIYHTHSSEVSSFFLLLHDISHNIIRIPEDAYQISQDVNGSTAGLVWNTD